MKGEVILVGAGPGDPGLITVAGRDALASADVVVHDALVSPGILALAPRTARRIYAGKRAGQHQFPQKEIHAILIKEARRGLKVVRLKGGDPFVFGRGGEEAEACRRAGIPFRVVPGVSSGNAVPACAGIPLTHRGLASAVAFVTGHSESGKEDDIAWASLATFPGTLVFFMSMKALEGISRNLRAHGMPESTPAAAIRSGSLPDQKVVVGTLATLPRKAARLGTPALVVVGKVVRLRSRLAWLERRPLFGRTVGVTRSLERGSELTRRLEALGASVLALPCIRHAPPKASGPWKRALKALAGGEFDWLVVSSPQAAQALWEGLAATLGLDARALGGVRIAALGPGTAEALGLKPDLLPRDPSAAGLLKAFRRLDLSGRRILLPRSDIAPKSLQQGLEALGASPTAVTAYRTLAEPLPPEALQALASGRVDAVLLASSSAARAFAASLRKGRLRCRARLVSMGPETSAALRSEGLRPAAEASPHTLDGLIAALRKSL